MYLNHLSNYFFDVFVVYVFGLCASVRIISWFLILFSGKTKKELLYHNFQTPFLSPNFLGNIWETGNKSLEHNTANRSEWSESTEHDYAWKTSNDFESEK